MRDVQAGLRGVSAIDGSTKAKLERAAVTLFADHGIDAVSTKQIAHTAGIAEGSIYRHFKSKNALAHHLMKTIHVRLTDMIHAASAQADLTLRQRVDYIVRHYCQIADADWPLFRYHILHLYHFPNLSDATTDNPMSAASALVDAAVKCGDLPHIDVDLYASMALGIVLQPAQSKVLGFYNGPLLPNAPLFTEAIMRVLNAR